MCRWESSMVEQGDDKKEGDRESEREKVGDKLRHKRMRKEGSVEPERWKKMHRHIQGEREGRRDGEGRKWEQERATDCRLCTCHTERKSTRQNQMSSFGKRLAGSLTHLAQGPLWLSSAITSSIHQYSSPLPRVKFIWNKHMQKKLLWNVQASITCTQRKWCLFRYLSDKQRCWRGFLSELNYSEKEGIKLRNK